MSVSGNIRATGDVFIGDKAVNVLEELESLRADVKSLELATIGTYTLAEHLRFRTRGRG